MTDADLFSWSRYPAQPGWKARDTSKDAAEAMSSRSVALRDKVHRTITASAGLTADEVASALEESVLAIRPRCTELARQFKISDSGIRRPNISGRNAIVWKAA